MTFSRLTMSCFLLDRRLFSDSVEFQNHVSTMYLTILIAMNSQFAIIAKVSNLSVNKVSGKYCVDLRKFVP